MNPRNPYFVAVYSQFPYHTLVRYESVAKKLFTYWRIYPRYHTACDDETTISFFIHWLLAEIVNG